MFRYHICSYSCFFDCWCDNSFNSYLLRLFIFRLSISKPGQRGLVAARHSTHVTSVAGSWGTIRSTTGTSPPTPRRRSLSAASAAQSSRAPAISTNICALCAKWPWPSWIDCTGTTSRISRHPVLLCTVPYLLVYFGLLGHQMIHILHDKKS